MSVEVGSVVRVPVGGRRLRGFVVERGERDDARLRAISALSGRSPVFDERLLTSIRWAAAHYVAPLSVILERAVPPNVPPAAPKRLGSLGAEPGLRGGPLVGEGIRALAGSSDVVWRHGGDLRKIVEGGDSAVVVVPTQVEADAVAGHLLDFLGDRLAVVHGAMDAKAVTAAWRLAAHRPTILVSTPRTAFWRVHRLRLAVVLEDGRRAMKDRQTPTVHVRDVLLERSRREGFGFVAVGPVPTPEVTAAAGAVRMLGRRAWPHVEVVDRRSDPPGSGLLGTVARQAIAAVVKDGGEVFVYAHRHGYAAATRCVRCRTIRKCPACGSRPDPGTDCSRCGAELGGCSECGFDRFDPLGAGVGRIVEEVRRLVPREIVGVAPEASQVAVGTERDLVALAPRRLAVMVDLDGLVLGTNYRAAEEALRIAARLAGSVSRRGRLIVQTGLPDHPVVAALQSGDPRLFLDPELATRAQLGYPPAGQLMVIETRGGPAPSTVDAELAGLTRDELVMGPATARSGTRWLVQAAELGRFKAGIRPLVQGWRDAGAAVRIDADPIDL